MIKERVTILDGLRVLAIFMVMLFHYYSRFLDTHYTYSFKMPTIFSYGYLGVELFFIISGFVISLTLNKCDGFVEFMKKRFVRLIPAMVICSTVTFLFVILFDSNNLFKQSKSIVNLAISNTFISPLLINTALSTNVSYIDGAYWSLWVEITFYILAGLFYFFSPKKFIRNFSLLVFLGMMGFFLCISEIGANILIPYIGIDLFQFLRIFFKIFTFFEYGIWFLIGMVLKLLYFDKSNIRLIVYFVALFFFQTLLILNVYTILFSITTLSLLLLFVFKPSIISFLGSKFLSKIGIASYSIYLLHQNIGVLSINKLSPFFYDFNWIIGLIVFVLISLLGIYSYKYIEMPLGKKLKSVFLKNNL